MNRDEVLLGLLALIITLPIWLLAYALLLPLLVLGISTLLNLGLGYTQALGVSLVMWLTRLVFN